MRASITNNAPGNQGVWTDEGLAHFEPGQTRTVTIAEGHVERTLKFPFLTVTEIDPLDRDENGDQGGSKPADPPSLSGKNKAELIAIAEAEGAEIEDGATVADIKAAIELNREA